VVVNDSSAFSVNPEGQVHTFQARRGPSLEKLVH
jgi:hypothetical protein